MEWRTVWEEVLEGGGMRSLRVRRGMLLRLTDLDGGGNLAALFYRADDPGERYNMPDTLKAQFTAFLTRGHALFSDMGRVLCSVVEDTCGWHDPLGGLTDAALTAAKYGPSSYQDDRNRYHRNGRDNFLVELAKHGLGERDLAANVNFFSKVWVDGDGRMNLSAGHSRPGARITLRTEMDVLAVFSNTPHPLDPRAAYAPGRVGLALAPAAPPGADDYCRNFRPENGRGFRNTEELYL